MALIKDEINKKTDNEWFKRLIKLIKYEETPSLYKFIKNGGWGANWAIPVFKDFGNGKANLGFGNQNALASAPVRVISGNVEFSGGFPESKIVKTATIHANKLGNGETIRKEGAFGKQDLCFAYKDANGKTVTSLVQVSLLANAFIYAAATNMWTRFQNDSELKDVISVMTDHEFCALLDLHYNIGEGWAGTLPSLKSAVARHQQAKIDKNKSAEAEALEDVKGNFLRACYADGKEIPKLKIRRTKAANMYGGGEGGMSDKYDNDSEWTSIVTARYKDIPASSMININLNQAKKEEAAMSSLVAIAGTGYSPKLLSLYGSGQPISKILEGMQKEDDAKKRADAESAYKINKKAITAADAASTNDDLSKLEMIHDLRTRSGLSIPENTSSSYSNEKGLSEIDRAKSNYMNNYGMFKKYKHTSDEDLGQAKTTWFFLTRPDMCLYQNTISEDKKSNKNYLVPSQQCMDPDLIDHLITDRDLYMYLDRNVIPEYLDNNTCFIPAFTNQFKNATLPEARFDMSKSSANINGVAINIPTYNSSDTADTEIPVTFNVDNELSIIKYIDLIFKYAKSVKEGTTVPYKESVKYNVIDFSTTMFAFVVSQDGVTLESMYRSVGVVPSVNPVTSIPLSSSPEKMESVTVSFKTNANLDSRKLSIINHFNLLNRYGCRNLTPKDIKVEAIGDITNYDDAIDWYCINHNMVESFILDNMEAEDWYCERFIIYMDTSSKKGEGGVYKLIGIPSFKRIMKIIDFLLNKNYNTFYNTLVDRSTEMYQLRPGVAAKYYKRLPNINKIKADVNKFVKDGENLDLFYKGWEDISKQVYKDMREDSEYYRNPGTGIRVLSNSKNKSTDGTMILNLFRMTGTDGVGQRNNMYDWFLDDQGKVRELTWMKNFTEFLGKISLNESAGKITNMITYAITGEMTISHDGKVVSPLDSNLGAVAIADENNTILNLYRDGVKSSISFYTKQDDGKYGITVHNFNTIDQLDKLPLFVDGLYIPLDNSAGDFDNQFQTAAASTEMKKIKEENIKFRNHLLNLNKKSKALETLKKSSPKSVQMLSLSDIMSLGIKQDISTIKKEELYDPESNMISSVMKYGATYNEVTNLDSANKNIHTLKYIYGHSFTEEVIRKMWEQTKSSRDDLNKILNPADWYLAIEADTTKQWKENSGIAPYLVIQNDKVVAYNTKSVFYKKEDMKSTMVYNKADTPANKSSYIQQPDFLKATSDNRFELLSFMNHSSFTKKFRITDWISFYSPIGSTDEGGVGIPDYIATENGYRVLSKYHDILYVSEWNKARDVMYTSKGMQIPEMKIPADKLKSYNDFLIYQNTVLTNMSDGAVIETQDPVTGEWTRTEKGKKMFDEYFPSDRDVSLHENRKKDSWTTKEGWENRLNKWWDNAKTSALETLFDTAIARGTQFLEESVKKMYNKEEENIKDGKVVPNEIDTYHASYVKVLDRNSNNPNKPRTLYFRETQKENTGLKEIQALSEIKPIPQEYYRNDVEFVSQEVQNKIAKTIAEETSASKILKLLRDI